MMFVAALSFDAWGSRRLLRIGVRSLPARTVLARERGKNTALRRNDRPGRDERAETRDREAADSSQPTERSTGHTAGAGTGRGTFRSLRVLLVSEVACAGFVGHQHRNVAAGETRGAQIADDSL